MNHTFLTNLENRLSEIFNDSIDVDFCEKIDDSYKAWVTYDGSDEKGHKGAVTFRCDIVLTGEILDFELLEYTGMYMRSRPQTVSTNKKPLPKQYLYKTAYSKLYQCYVKINHVNFDGEEFTFACAVKGQNDFIWFREAELTKFCL